jgi:hypothetical protein
MINLSIHPYTLPSIHPYTHPSIHAVTFSSFCVVGLYVCVCVFQEMESWILQAADWSVPSLIGALTPPSRQGKQLDLQLPTPSAV